LNADAAVGFGSHDALAPGDRRKKCNLITLGDSVVLACHTLIDRAPHGTLLIQGLRPGRAAQLQMAAQLCKRLCLLWQIDPLVFNAGLLPQ
jgi:hypothetical protein